MQLTTLDFKDGCIGEMRDQRDLRIAFNATEGQVCEKVAIGARPSLLVRGVGPQHEIDVAILVTMPSRIRDDSVVGGIIARWIW